MEHALRNFTCFFLSFFIVASPVYAGKTYTIDQHKGLQRNPQPEYTEDGSWTKFDNLYVVDGHIEVVKGRVKLNTTSDTNTTKNMLCYYENAAGTTKKYVVQEGTVLASYDTDWTDRTELNTGLTNEYHSCKQVGDTLYITSDTDGLYKWTGSGAATAISGVSAPSAVDFSASSTVGGKTSGQPILISASLSTDTTCGLSTNGFSGSGNCELSNTCLFVASHDLGGSGVTSDDGVEEAAVTATTYSYKVTKYSSKWGIESEPSTADTVTLTGDSTFSWNATDCFLCDPDNSCTAGDCCHDLCCSSIENISTKGAQTSTTGTLAATPSAPFDGYCIYGTVANGTDYFKLGCVVGGGTTYTDGKPDVALNGPLDTTIDTINPPSYKYITEYKGSLFLAQGSTVNFTRLPVQSTTSADTYWLETDELSTGSKENITGIHSTSNSALIFMPNKTLELTGFGVSSFRLKTLYEGIGSVSHDTVETTIEGDIIFFAGGKGVFQLKIGQPTTDSAIGSILDTNRAQLQHISSPAMDDVFQGIDSQIDLDPADYPSSHAYYDQDNRLYFLFIGEHGFIYSEESKSWTHVTGVKATQSVYRKSPNGAGQGLILDNLGHAYDNFKSYTFGGPGSGTLTGNPTSSTSTTLTDSGASFYTTDDGLTGVWVAKVTSTGVIEYRQITSNTGTELTVGSAWTANPVTTDTYYIGYIIPDATTKMYSLSKPPGETVIQSVTWIHNKSDATQLLYNDITYKTMGAITTPTWSDWDSFDLATNFIDKRGVSTMGNWIQLNLRSFVSNTSDTINPPIDIINYSIFAYPVEAE